MSVLNGRFYIPDFPNCEQNVLDIVLVDGNTIVAMEWPTSFKPKVYAIEIDVDTISDIGFPRHSVGHYRGAFKSGMVSCSSIPFL
jgi:hypothetical protein